MPNECPIARRGSGPKRYRFFSINSSCETRSSIGSVDRLVAVVDFVGDPASMIEDGGPCCGTGD